MTKREDIIEQMNYLHTAYGNFHKALKTFAEREAQRAAAGVSGEDLQPAKDELLRKMGIVIGKLGALQEALVSGDE